MLECNYLTILLKPSYEKPVDTVEDVLDRGLSIINGPGRESIVELNKKSPFDFTRMIAERTTVAHVNIFNISKVIETSWSLCDDKLVSSAHTQIRL